MFREFIFTRSRLFLSLSTLAFAISINGLLLFTSFTNVNAAHFFVSEGSDKCFIENVPHGVPLTVAYKNIDNPGVTCSIIYKNPSGRQVYSKEILPSHTQGKVTHLTATAGEYKICISCASFKWFSTTLLKWSISIELGDTDLNIQVMAQKKDVSSVTERMNRIFTIFKTLYSQNEYEKEQEEAFRENSENVNFIVFWFIIGQILLLCLLKVFLIFYQTHLFVSEKIF